MAIHIDHAGESHRHDSEPGGETSWPPCNRASAIAGSRSCSVRVDRTIQVCPATADADVGFVHAQRGKDGPWIDFIWRFDSGLVAGSVPDLQTAFGLTAAQQADIGFYCGSTFAQPFGAPITQCATTAGATRVVIPRAGTENDDTNPPRVSPRNLFDVALGTDNIFHSETSRKVSARLTVTNLANNVALYNFLSTFSGTHFVPPRTFQMSIAYTF